MNSEKDQGTSNKEQRASKKWTSNEWASNKGQVKINKEHMSKKETKTKKDQEICEQIARNEWESNKQKMSKEQRAKNAQWSTSDKKNVAIRK